MMKKHGSKLKVLCCLMASMFLLGSLSGCDLFSLIYSSDADSSSSSSSADNENSSSGGTVDQGTRPEGTYNWEVKSQDGNIAVNVYYDEGAVSYDVKYGNKVVVEKSGLGLKTSTMDLTDYLTFVEKQENKDVEISYDTITGKKSTVSTVYNELVVSLEKEDCNFDIILRAYNDGFAFRYDLNSNSAEATVITKENSQFALPEKTLTYVQEADYRRDYFSYEESYEEIMVEKLNLVQASMPMLYQTKDDVWALLTESDLYGHDYIGSFLECDEEGVLTTIPAYGSENQVEVSLPFQSPWRLGIVGSLATVVESTLVEDVYDEVEYWRPDNYDELSEEEKEIYNYDWVTPGAAAWDWLKNQNSQGNYYMHMEYLNFAIENNLNWIILDGGWGPGNPDSITMFKKLIKQAHENNIKVMVWGWAHDHMGDEKTMLETLDKWTAMGIDGLKIDYFDGNNQNTGDRVESQNTLKITERLYQECAKRKLVLNCHGCNKPTGERRVYPHVFNREAIRGNENTYYYMSDMVAMPFIRGVVGPSDYTPTLNPVSIESTVGSQLAMHLLLETGSISLADTIQVYNESIAKDFIMGMPARFDDMKLLGGNPSEYCTIMRQAGEEYYVAGITIDSREFVIDLSFLEEGKSYNVEIYYDAYVDEDSGWSPVVPLPDGDVMGSGSDGLLKRVQTVTKGAMLKVGAPECGGFALKITEIKN